MSMHTWNDLHMIRAWKSLSRALYITLGFFLFLFALFHIIGALYVYSIATKSSEAFQVGIKRDMAYLKEQGDEVAKNESLIEYLVAGDSYGLIDITKKEKNTRGIGLIGVANSEGLIVSRTIERSSLGQNVFLTVPAGRVVSEGQSVESIELTGFGNQLFITTARPIIREGVMIGALFANQFTDDEYAGRFRDTYLRNGTEIIFYTNEFGVYGNSFLDPKIRELINSYFNTGSDWIKNGSSGRTISFEDSNFYVVENIIFPSLKQNLGGALIFIPRADVSNILNSITALLTLFVFLFFALKYHSRSRGEERGWLYHTLFIIVSIFVFILSLFVLRIQDIGYFNLERVPYRLYNSTLRLQPESGIYDVDFEQRFSIMVDTGDEDINAVQIGLIFDKEMIDIKALEINDSTCSYVIENVIDNSLGKADLSCVLLKIGGERGSLRIADVVVLPKKTGTFTLSFDKIATKVLASDGLGTNVLRMAQSGSYQVDTFDSMLSTTTATPKSFVVFSPTHPNKSRWYNSNDVHFVWKGKPGAVYKYEFNNSPNTIPSNYQTTQDSEVTIPVPGDGKFYFHLQLTSGGPIDRYSVQIDRTPPSIIDIRSSSETIVTGDVVRFSFDANDAGSGIQRNYYADLGNHLFLPVGSELFVPFLEPGEHDITLRVYDDAGNYSEKTQVIYVHEK